MIILKCGKCGKEFEVDEERIKSGQCGYCCSNCGAQVPPPVAGVAERLASMGNKEVDQSWQVYRIPERYAKAQVTLTLPKE